MTTMNPIYGLLTLFGRLIMLWVGFWALVTFVICVGAMWTEAPVLMSLLVVGLGAVLIARSRYRRRVYRQHLAELNARKAALYRQQRVERAQQYPQVVFEENAPAWEREMAA